MSCFRPILRAGALTLAALLGACAGYGPAKPGAVASLAPTEALQPNPTSGSAHFTALPGGGVRLNVEVRGLAPGSEHGFHIHEKGDCADNGNAAGGHFNPSGGRHGMFGAPGGHAGDLPSLLADASGTARFRVDVPALSLTDGAPGNVVGRAVVVHRDPDDHMSQPAGNSGPRIACGVITRE